VWEEGILRDKKGEITQRENTTKKIRVGPEKWKKGVREDQKLGKAEGTR